VGCAVVMMGCATATGCSATRVATSAGSWKGSPAAPIRYVGLISSGLPGSYTPVTDFRAAVGTPVNLAGYYSGWGEAFQSGFARTAWEHGTETMVDVDPPHGETAMEAVAGGQDDAYLTGYAEAVRAFGHPVVIDFGHEMNGDWSGFGYGSVRPATFIAVYRHVHDLFQRLGARNVVWVWAVNAAQGGVAAPREFFPGDGYVTWIGIDGYDWSAELTFQQRFGPTLAAIRRFTAKPVLISETSVLPTTNSGRQVTSWLDGIAADHLLGLVWFDNDKTHSEAKNDKHDWRLEDDPAALIAFRSAVHTRR
jgi:hypothetical protein